jgi:two-component system sensor histidine kinase/response regulator
MEIKPRILIIDDEEVIRDSCIQILGSRNYEVTTAPDGTSGLKKVLELQPDLIFVDLKMPGISGFEVLEKVSELDPTIVTVVITGYATVSSAVEAMKVGAYDFLPKPFTPDEFRLITRRGLEKRKLVLETIALRREKEMLRENFAAIVSHELKSPLGAIQQNLYALEAETADKLTEIEKSRLERMKVRIDDLLKLINTWLRLISVDISKLKENFTSLEVETAIAKAIESAEPQATRKNIDLISSIEGNLRPVQGHEISLVEALVNIIGNGVKYSYDNSKVRIKAEEKQDRILISISDTGIGISKDELPSLFGDFYRGKTGNDVEGSHGIGLTISRRIIEAHEGTITAESELGKGTTFTINLPVSHEELATGDKKL